MPVLLLCRGEPEAKNRLRQAIEARYGQNPPAIEQISIGFKGRTRVKLGPVTSWVPVDAQATFAFPTHLRWDFAVKPLKLPVQKGIEAYDGTTYRSQRAIGNNNESIQTDLIAAARGRLWQMAAILLTPMSDYYIEIKRCGADCLEAVNTKLNDSVQIYLRKDHKIDYTVVRCLNPDSGRDQNLYLRLSQSQAPVNGMILPEQVSAFWDNEPFFELSPTKVNTHPDLREDFFTLGAEITSDGAGD